MKPARGSARSSKQGPKGQIGKLQRSRKQVRNDEETQEFSKKSSALAGVRKVKGQDKWKPMPKSSVVVLDNMLGLSILSVLTMKMKEKEESQAHLNLLKKQFIAKCSQLPVPPQKYGNLMQVSQQFHTESQKVTQGKKKIEELEESTRLVLSSLEQLQSEVDGLERKCRVLRDKLEEAELNGQEFIGLREQAVLHLTALAPYPDDEPTLQEQIVEVLPNPQAVMKALQNSKKQRL